MPSDFTEGCKGKNQCFKTEKRRAGGTALEALGTKKMSETKPRNRPKYKIAPKWNFSFPKKSMEVIRGPA